MKTDYLKNEIKEQYRDYGNELYSRNAQRIVDGINAQDKEIMPVNVGQIERGKFYFIFYDLKGKSSKMEQFNPVFVIDWFDMDNTRSLYAVSINFIPVSIRTVFFNNIANHNLKIIADNATKSLERQEPLANINFANIYKLLYSIGFEWSIRKFDFRLIQKAHVISTNILPTFVTMSTVKMTGVDDLKLIDIWNAKIKDQENRQKRMIKELLGDFRKIEKELTDTYLSLDKQNANLEESLQLIKTIF